ncbi:MAG: PAS domain S-box protein [Candidatus Sigynarchaeota archaeon]
MGYLGLERAREGASWNQTTLQSLELIGEILSQFLQRVENERAFKESEENFRAVFESSQDPLIIMDLQGNITWVNEALKAITGYSRKTLGDMFDKIVKEDVPKVRAAWDALKARETRSIQDLDVRFYHASRRVLYLKVSIVYIERLGHARYFLSAHDITSLKESEALIKQSQERYLNLFENMRDGVAIYQSINDGADFIIKDLNKVAERIDAVSKVNVIGKTVREAFPGAETSGILSAFQRVYREGKPVEIGPVLYQDARITGWREYYIYMLSNGEIVAMFSDISEKIAFQEKIQKAEALVRKSEEKYRLITESINDMISLVTREFKFEFINESVGRVLGYRPEELMGISRLGLFHPDDVKKVLEILASIRGNGTSETVFEARLRHKNGNYVWFETKTRKIQLDNETKLLFVSRDITSRKLAEAKLKESEARYRIMMENASDLVALLDDKFFFEYVNQNQLNILGHERENLIGKSLFDFIHPGDIECNIESFMCDFIAGNAIGEYRLQHKDGHYVWFEGKGSTFIDDRGDRKILLFSRDVSESKKLKDELIRLNKELEHRVEERTLELKAAQEKLVRQEKLAVAGRIAGTISHELRNPLGAINNSIYFLNLKMPEADEKVKKHLMNIQNEVDRATRIITDLLDFTRIKQPEFVTGDVVPVIKNALSHVAIPPGINTRFEIDPASVHIKLDPGLLQQAFINIITNAIQAMPQGGTLAIMLSTNEESVIIRFQDSGVGISKENMKLIFEPLFSTKKTGIGLGLSLVKDIVENHGGKISVESEVNHGTCFEIMLPLKHQPS